MAVTSGCQTFIRVYEPSVQSSVSAPTSHSTSLELYACTKADADGAVNIATGATSSAVELNITTVKWLTRFGA